MAQSRPREAKPRQGSPSTSATDLFRLDGRTILITGGGGAMGLEIASAVLELGGDVICVDCAATPLDEPWEKALSIATKNSTNLTYHGLDISSPTASSDITIVFTEALSAARFPFRGMVACAGISGGGTTVDFPLEEAKRIIDTNILGTFLCCQAAGRVFKQQEEDGWGGGIGGSLVIIASMSAHGSNKGVDTTIYNLSKSSLLQLARSLAAEWGATVDMPSVRVNTISPGYIRTRMTAKDLEDKQVEREWEEGNMLNRLSTADEYRCPAVFLLSQASSFVTGADLRVDGGHTAW